MLPYVPKEGEKEVLSVFDAVVDVRDRDPAVREIADMHLFETVVRVHRAGEGAPYTGLKPSGLDHGPILPVAERAIERGSADELVGVLTRQLEDEVRGRFVRVMELRERAGDGVDASRAYVGAMLDLEVWAHHLHLAMEGSPHEH